MFIGYDKIDLVSQEANQINLINQELHHDTKN